MRGRNNIHKTAYLIFVVDVPDGQGGTTKTLDSFITQYVEMVRVSGSRNVEGLQIGQNTAYNCKMYVPATGIPSETDILRVEGKDYTISNAYIDDSERVKYLRFIATQRT